MSDNPDTIDTILDDMLNDGHTGPADSLEWIQAKMKFYADRIKAAWKRQCSQSWHHREMEELILRHEKEVAELKNQTGNSAALREADSIHRAMVLIAGIKMENPKDPPRLWTALEDAYDALSDALGTDGDTTADEEEAKATGRHFVVRSSGDRAKLRDALANLVDVIDGCDSGSPLWWHCGAKGVKPLKDAKAALSAPRRNCDVGTAQERMCRYNRLRDEINDRYKRLGEIPPAFAFPTAFEWEDRPYEEGGEK